MLLLAKRVLRLVINRTQDKVLLIHICHLVTLFLRLPSWVQDRSGSLMRAARWPKNHGQLFSLMINSKWIAPLYYNPPD